MPGALAATGGWVLLSVAFSYYVANMGNYSAVYGSIGAIIILMVWLFLSAVVIIMGDELNCVLIESRTNITLE
jgi:membrane protein